MNSIVFVVVLFTLFFYSCENKPLSVGDSVPDFTLHNYDGIAYSLEEILSANKFTLLIFTSIQCPSSNAYNERNNKLQLLYGKIGVSLVGINSNYGEDKISIGRHAVQNGINYLVLKDEGNKVADAFGAKFTPEVFVVNSKGKLLYHGRIDDNFDPGSVKAHDLTNTLDELLKGKTVPMPETEISGCPIKRMENYEDK